MNDTIIVALISGLCTLLGGAIGAIASSNLTNYRIERLEQEVNKHNNLIERVFVLEGKMEEAIHDIRDLKNK